MKCLVRCLESGKVTIINIISSTLKYFLCTFFLVATTYCFPSIGNEADDFKLWIDSGYKQVKSGDLKWSDFYKQMFTKVISLKAIKDKSNMLESINMRIRASQEYEAGNITAQEFNNRQREAMVLWAKPSASNEIIVEQAPTQPIRLFNDPVNCNSTTFGNTINTKCW